MSLIRLRPHHLICNLCFNGKGYDEIFTQNFTKINNELQINNETKIKIVQGCDDICAKCPKNKSHNCEDENIVTAIDNAYLQTLGLELGQIITAKDLHDKIKSKVTLPQAQSICKNCSWYNVICNEIMPKIFKPNSS